MAELGAQTQPQQSARFDTGRDVLSPHEPRPIGQDEQMLGALAGEHDAAAARLAAHRAELDEQIAFHEREIARAQRVMRACEQAATELKSEEAEQAEQPTMAPPLRSYAGGEAPGFA